MKKIVLALLIFALSNSAFALTGEGTETSPYLINNLGNFDEFASNSFYWGTGVHTKLNTDINLSGRTYNKAVIAYDINGSNGIFDGIRFGGSFNGNGHLIKNLTINGGINDDILGLFGSANFFG